MLIYLPTVRRMQRIQQGWRAYSTCSQNGTLKDLLGTLPSLLSQSFCVCCPTRVSILRRICVYMHNLTAYGLYMNYRRYQIIPQWNIFTQIGAVRSVDWMFIVGVPFGRWRSEYVTLDRTFYCLLIKLEVTAAPVTATFSSSSHSLRKPLLEI